MGSSSSKRSAASDAGSNLLWSLEQLAAWEEKLSEDETFLTEQMSRSKSFNRSEMMQDYPEMNKQRDREQFEQRREFDRPIASGEVYPQQNMPQMNIQQQQQQVFEQREPLIQFREQDVSQQIPQAQFQSVSNIPESDRTVVQTTIEHEPRTTFASNVPADTSYAAPKTTFASNVPADSSYAAPKTTFASNVPADTSYAATTNIPDTRYDRSESINPRDSMSGHGAFTTTATAGEIRPQSEFARSTDSYPTGTATSGIMPSRTYENTRTGAFSSPGPYSTTTGVTETTPANWEAKNISPSGKIRIPLLQGAQETYVAPSTTTRKETIAPSLLKADDPANRPYISDAGATAGITGTGIGAGSTAGITGTGLGASSTAGAESVQFDEELFLPQKYHFAYQALQTLVAGAERNFRLSCRSNLLRQRASNQSQPLLKLANEKKLDSINGLLNSGLVSWDNAVAAVEWLQKDYDLGLRWVKLSRELRGIQAEREALFTQRPMGTNLTEEEARKAKYAADNQIRAKSDTLMTQINDVRKRLTDIMRDIANHQRDSLSIGLMFLDKNMSGAIEPEDIPNLHSDLFAALDISGKHKITTAHLQNTVDKMLNDVVSIERQLKDLEVSIARDKEEEQQKLMQVQGTSNKEVNNLQKFQANILGKQEQYSFLYSELQRKRRILDRLYQVFGQSFIRQVLKKLDTPADEVVERVQQLMVDKRQEDRGVSSNFAINRQWQPPVDV